MVFAEGDAVDALTDLDASGASDQGEQASRVGAARREAGDEGDDLGASLIFLADRAHETGDLPDAREGGVFCQIGAQARGGVQRAPLGAAVAVVRGGGGVGGGAWVGDIRLQIVSARSPPYSR